MLHALRINWQLFIGIFLLMMGNGLLATLLTVRATELGFSQTVIGAVQACYPIGALVSAFLAPKLVERIGHVRTFGVLASTASVAAVVHLLTADPYSWGLMRLLGGFCFSGLYVVCESWLNARAENTSRGKLLSIYFVAQIVGSSAGQLLVGIPDPSGLMLFGVVSILISIALVPMLISVQPAPEFEAPDRLSIRELFRISPMAVTGSALNGMGQSLLYISTPVYALAIGYTGAEAGLLLTTATMAGALSQFPLGWLSDRMDRRYVVALSGAVSCIGCLAIAGGFVAGYLHATVALIAAFTFPVYSICVAHANDKLKPSQIVPASGALVLSIYIGILTGAFSGPAIIDAMGPQALYGLLAAVQGTTFLIALFRRMRRDAPEETGAAPALTYQVSPVAARLNPDARE
ncbi:MAG: MFS transporter [Alphaproteobacteria bacterium]